ncbi:hypothetical protein KFL_004830100 [Klebsormidium nitens]|uniref:Uncharacterized protein n=1 Tax=Klebsormidium nitens TaxID=105231 RepID=A0A1Y1IHT2_KLENI|nr:hypothetical protein KFL_004830100 [Klebsormidium nitens]|eukprot:GAQ89059.1 hypothetical protein KFL_004830100 [Klebsormidium nitens]
MATPVASAPWAATWQLNAGASPHPGDTNLHTTGPSAENGTGLYPQMNADSALGNRGLGAIEGEELRTIVETVEKMQAKDPEKAQEAVSYCRKGLEGDEKGERLRMLANMSAEWTEVFHAWEVHHGAGNHKVCQQLLLFVADLLRHPLGTSAHLKQSPLKDPSREEAAVVHLRLDGLARNIVRKRMKQVYGHLTSGQRGRANACLMLLTAINGRGKSLSGELVGTFDFTLASLAKLAAPPKQTGKGEREGGNNPEKRSTRAVFTEFALSFILVGDPLTTRSALQKRSLFTPVLHNLYGDSAEQIARVLSAIQAHVLPETAGVPARLQGVFFGDIALEQLINIAAFDDSPDTGDVSLARPASLAHDVLLWVFSDPAHGVCPAAQVAGKKSKDAASQGRLLRALLKLKATEVQRHSDLLIGATKEQPAVAAAYLAAFPYSLEPRTSDRWFAAMTLLRKLVAFASREGLSADHSALTVKALLTRIVTPALPRAVLSRALQHRSTSIKFVLLAVLSSVLASLHSAQSQLKATGSPILNELADGARLLLPDPQILLALNTTIEKGDAGRTGGKPEGLEEGLEEDETEESVSTEELHLKLLEVLAGYQRSLPDALAACRFNPYKLLPDNPAQLPRGKQAALLELLAAASEAAGADSAAVPSGASPQLLPLLREMLGGTTEELREKAEALAHQSLMASGVFSHQLEVATWLELLPRWDASSEGRPSFSLSDSVAGFFADAFFAVSKNPYRFLERIQSALSAHTLLEVPEEKNGPNQRIKAPVGWETMPPQAGSSGRGEREVLARGCSSGPEFGPLVVCAIEKCLKVLAAGQSEGDRKGSAGKPGGLGLLRKTGIAAYVAGSLRRLLEVQRNPRTLAVVVVDLLAEISEEEASACEWAPLFSLRTAAQTILTGPSETLTSFANPLQTPSTALDEAIEDYASGDPSDRPALARALGYALLTSPPGEVARTLPELTSAFCGAGMETTEAARAIGGGVLQDLVKTDPGLLSSAARCSPEAFRKALKILEEASEIAEVKGADRRTEAQHNSLASFLSTVPFSALLSPVCGVPPHPESPSAASVLSLETPGVKTLLGNLLKPLTAIQRATAVRVLLHHLHSSLVNEDNLQTLTSGVDTLFGLLRQAVFTPPVNRDLSLAQPETVVQAFTDPALAVDALQHPALSTRFLRQHDVTGAAEVNCRIADLVRDLLLAAHPDSVAFGAAGSFAESEPTVHKESGAGLSDVSRESLERACSPYVERAVVQVEKRLRKDASDEGLEAAIKLVPFGETTSLLRLLDLLLPPLAQTPQILQNPELRLPLVPHRSRASDALKTPALRRLTLQLASKVLSEPPRALTLDVSVTSAKGAIGAETGVGVAKFREVYRRVADPAVADGRPDGMDGTSGTDGMDECLLAALRSTERALLETAYRTVGVPLSGTVPSSSGDRPNGPLSIGRPMGSASQHRPIDSDAHSQTGGLLLLNDLAKATPTALVRTYVEQPSETRAEILRVLVRHSTEHRAEFGAQLSRLLGDTSAENKLLLVAPVEEYLREATSKDSAESGEEEGAASLRGPETERSGDAVTVAKLFLGLVTEYLVNPGSDLTEDALKGGLRGSSGLEGPGTALNGGTKNRRGAKRKAEAGTLSSEGLETGRGDAAEEKERTAKKRKTDGLEAQAAKGPGNGTRVLESEESEVVGTAEPIGNGVELFRCCSALVPVSTKERSRLLRKLLPKGGWRVEGPEALTAPSRSKENGSASSGAEEHDSGTQFRIRSVHCLQQAAAVARLLILNTGEVEERVESGPNKTEEAPTSSDVQIHSKHLRRYAQTLMTSLAGLHRSQGGSGGETERVKSRLEEGLLALLAEAAGNVSGLTDKFAAAVASFVESVLRWRFADVVSLTVARLLLAAVGESTDKSALESRLAEIAEDGVTPMEAGQTTADDGVANGVKGGGVSGDQSVSDSQKVAEMGARLFDLLVSHSQFVPTLLASRAERGSLNQNVKPLPEALGKHSGDFVPSSLASILSLLDTPPLPVGFERSTPQMAAGKAGANAEGFADAEASVSGIITELLSPLPLGSAPNEAGRSLARSQNPSSEHGTRSSIRTAAAPVKSEPLNTAQSEVVQLLTVLLGLRKAHANSSGGTDAQPVDDLLSLLLAAYGATMSGLDRRILHLMRQIDGQEGARGLVGMDYLWGERALRSRQEQRLSGVAFDTGARSRQFREESPLDPRRCGLAVLYFPVRRSLYPAQPDEGTRNKGAAVDPEEELRSAAYDPSFLLPFAVHVLKTSAMEARDFARSGLLQLALASLAAADEGMRRAGYNVLALYMANLEDPATSFREKQQVRLLLHYVRNAITEPLQRIPMTSAAFAAEAACIQMHPEHALYGALNKFLLKRPALDLEDIPLFYSLFNSGSPSYRTERVWMLRLLAAGLVTSADGRVFRRRFVLELLMSFAGSAMADAFTRRLVMQVFRHAVRIHKCASDLVDHAGLVPWLANLVVSPRLGPASPDTADTAIIAGMALEVLEVLLAAASDDWSRDAVFDDFRAAITVVHRKLAVTVDDAVSAAILVPFLRLAAGLAAWNARRKRSAGPVFSTSELRTLLWYVSASGSLGAVRWALQLLLHSPRPSMQIGAPPDCWHVADWAVMAGRALDTSSFTPTESSRASWCEKVLGWLPKSSDPHGSPIGDLQRLTAILS